MSLFKEFEGLANQTLGSFKRWDQGTYVESYGETADYGMCAALSALWLSSRKQTRQVGDSAYRSAFLERVAAKRLVDQLQSDVAQSIEATSSSAVDQLLFIDNHLKASEGFQEAPPTAKSHPACWYSDPKRAGPLECGAPSQIADFVRAEAGYFFIGCYNARFKIGAHAMAAENVDGKDHIVFFDPNFGRVTWGHDRPGYGGKAFTAFFTSLQKNLYDNAYSEFVAKRYL